MRLISCHIENFGKLSNVDIDFNGSVHKICERNGWGKTTLSSFILSMFYGLEGTNKKKYEENERKQYLPWNSGYFGGELTFEVDGKKYIILRNFGKKDNEATFQLLDASTRLESGDYSEKIGEELFGVNRESFVRTAFIGHNDIKYQGSNSVINAKVGSLSQQGDLENYDKAKALLKDYLNAKSPTRSTGELSKLKNSISELERDIATTEDLEKRLNDVRENISSEERKLSALEERNKALTEARNMRSEIDGLEKSVKALPGIDKSKMDRLAKIFESGVPEEQEFDDKIGVCNEVQNLIQKNDTLEMMIETIIDNAENAANTDDKVQQARADLVSKRKRLTAFSIVSIIVGIAIIVLAAVLKKSFLMYAVAGGTVFILEGIITMYKTLSEKVVYTGGTGASQTSINDKNQIERYKQNIKANNDTIKSYENELKEFFARFGASYSRVDAENFLYDLKSKSKEYKETTVNIELYDNQTRDIQNELAEKKASWDRFIDSHPELKGEDTDVISLINEFNSEMNESRSIIARLTQEQQDILERIDDLNDKKDQLAGMKEYQSELSARYDIVKKTDKYLTSAKDNFVAAYMAPLKTSFEKYYETLTGDKGDFEIDASLSISLREEGSYHDVETQSDGIGDMIGLAARMALLDSMYEGEKPFIIMDDSFVNLDDTNLVGAKKFLDEISKEYQVIYLTCHSH